MAHPFAPHRDHSAPAYHPASISPSTESSLPNSTMSSPHTYTNVLSPIKFIPYSKPSTPNLKVSIPFINFTPEEKVALPIIDLCTLSPTDMLPFIDLCTPANSPDIEAPQNSLVLCSATQKAPPPPIPMTPRPHVHFQESMMWATVSSLPDLDVVMDSPSHGCQTKRRLPTPDTPTKVVHHTGHGFCLTSSLLPISDEQINKSCGIAWTTGDTISCITQTRLTPLTHSPVINYKKLANKNLLAKKRPDGSFGGWVLPKMPNGMKQTTAKHAKPIYRPIQKVKEHVDSDLLSEGYQHWPDIVHWNHNAPVSMLDLPYQSIRPQLADKTLSFWVITRGNLMGVFDRKEDMLKSTCGFSWAVVKGFADEFNALLVWELAWKDHLIGRNAGPDKFPDPMQAFNDEHAGKISLFDKGRVPDKQQLFWVVIAGLTPKIYTKYEAGLNAAGKTNFSLVKAAVSEYTALQALHYAVGCGQVKYIPSDASPSTSKNA